MTDQQTEKPYFGEWSTDELWSERHEGVVIEKDGHAVARTMYRGGTQAAKDMALEMVRGLNARSAMLDALEAAEALIADRPKQGGKTWTLKTIRNAIKLAKAASHV